MGGGPTGYADQVHSIMDVLMGLPHATRVHPGHVEATTSAPSGSRTRSSASGAASIAEGTERCTVRGEPATLILFGPDYDGTHKARVRFDDGRDAIVGGSAVTRG